METTTSFDLNRAIEKWRNDLAKFPSLQGENLDVLESHLRDSVAALAEKGLSPEEAFLIAVRRCGHPKQLQAEFSKLNLFETWFFRVVWVLVGSLALLNAASIFISKRDDLAEFPDSVDSTLPTIVLWVLALTALNAFLLRHAKHRARRQLITNFLYRLTMAVFSGSLILACGSTFQIYCASWLNYNAISLDVAEQTLSGIWFSYGFIITQILILILLLAYSFGAIMIQKRWNRNADPFAALSN